MTETPLPIRVENGIRWLTDHDPDGAYHLWFSANIAPGAKMPAQPVEKREGYKVYFKARVQFEKLWDKLQREEAMS